MKIITNNLANNPVTRSGGQDQAADAGKFDAMLREATDSGKTAGSASTQSLSSITSAAPIDTAMLLNLDTSKIVSDTEQLVSTLEEFQTKLASADIPLEDLSSIVEKMDRERDQLVPSLEVLPQTDPLRDVLNNVLVACTVETEKFRRGDYLS